MKKFILIIAGILFIISIIVVFSHLTRKKYYNTVTSGIVIAKNHDTEGIFSIDLSIIKNKNYETEIKKIIVKNENIWNLIQIEHSYFVNFSWITGKLPVLEEIEINNEYKKKYDSIHKDDYE